MDPAEPRQDVRVNAISRIVRRLSVSLEPNEVFVQAFTNGIRADPDFAPIVSRQIGKPFPRTFLGLSKRQNMPTVGVGHVVGGTNRSIAAALLRAVVASNPSAALNAFAITDRQSLGD